MSTDDETAIYARITVYRKECAGEDYRTDDGSGFPDDAIVCEDDPIDLEEVTLSDVRAWLTNHYGLAQWEPNLTGSSVAYDPDGTHERGDATVYGRWAKVEILATPFFTLGEPLPAHRLTNVYAPWANVGPRSEDGPGTSWLMDLQDTLRSRLRDWHERDTGEDLTAVAYDVAESAAALDIDEMFSVYVDLAAWLVDISDEATEVDVPTNARLALYRLAREIAVNLAHDLIEA